MMMEKEGSKLTSSHGHTKITTIYRVIIYENEPKTSRKDFPRLKVQRRGHNRCAGGVETRYSQDSHPQVSDPQVGGISQAQRSSPRSEGSEPHVGLLAQEFCTER